MSETLQTAVHLPKIGHIPKSGEISPKSWGNLHRGEIIDLPKVLGNGFQISHYRIFDHERAKYCRLLFVTCKPGQSADFLYYNLLTKIYV
jgi:hypothetical protein